MVLESFSLMGKEAEPGREEAEPRREEAESGLPLRKGEKAKVEPSGTGLFHPPWSGCGRCHGDTGCDASLLIYSVNHRRLFPVSTPPTGNSDPRSSVKVGSCDGASDGFIDQVLAVPT